MSGRPVKCPLFLGKILSICHFSCVLPASICVHYSQVLVFTSAWDTQKGLWDFSVLCFLASGYLGTPKHCKTREAQKWQIDPFLPPHKCPFLCPLLRPLLVPLLAHPLSCTGKRPRYTPPFPPKQWSLRIAFRGSLVGAVRSAQGICYMSIPDSHRAT